MIGEVLTRCQRIAGVDEVICAIPLTKGNDKLADEAANYCKLYNSPWPEDDVLRRYYGAAKLFEADVIVRITGDCPLISPELCGAVVFKRNELNADYASNIMPRTFPKGLDCEVFTYDTLVRAVRQGPDEHVTTWMQKSKKVKRVNVTSPWQLDGRLTLDTWDDYKVICAAFGHDAPEHLRAA